MKPANPDAIAHWDAIRTAIEPDMFKAPPRALMVSVEITDNEAADIAAFARRRSLALAERAKK